MPGTIPKPPKASMIEVADYLDALEKSTRATLARISLRAVSKMLRERAE